MDWKDALSAARNNFEEAPEEENSHDNFEESEKKSTQQNPLTVITDKKGRNGKIATIIEGFTISQEEVENVARTLKQKLGVGGSVRPGEILIQGNHKDTVVNFLKKLQFKIK